MLEFAPYLLPNMFKDLLVSQFPLKASSWTENKFFFFCFTPLKAVRETEKKKKQVCMGKRSELEINVCPPPFQVKAVSRQH